VALLSRQASGAKRQNFVQINGEELDLTDVSHELLLFVEQLVLHLRKARASFEQSPGNVGAAKAIEDYKKYHTPDNTEFEVSYNGEQRRVIGEVVC
jgi:hypothetical protein